MDWIKVKTNHALYEYVDFSPTEFQAWIKIMALTAQLEHEPTREQMLRFVNHQTLSSLSAKLQQHSSDLSAILQKVLSDVSGVVHMKEYWKNKKKEKRALEQIVHMDIQKMSNDRLDKIREDKIIKNKERGFHPPSLTDVSAYCKERKNTINPQTFVNHYESNGWMVGKNKMKDWRAAVRNWETRGGNDNAGRGQGNRSARPGLPLPPEHRPEPAPVVSPEERKRNLERLAGIINGA